ncbi:spore maturation protein CgeB [Amorphus suaedae]
MDPNLTILVIGKFYAEGFALHIAETLVDMGHDVRRFEPGLRTSRLPGRAGQRVDQVRGLIHTASDNLPAIRAKRMKPLWREATAAPLDLVIVCYDFLWPEEVHHLKKLTGAPVAMWYPDAMVNFGRGYFLNAPYDGIFFKDPYIVHALADVPPSPIYYLPECFNPKRHRLPEGETIGADYICDLATAGSAHSWRIASLRHLSDYDVKLWGPAPPLWMPLGPVASMYQGRTVLNDEKARAFLGAKIVLNNLYYGEIWGANVRMFEAAGIGGFQMVDWRPGIAQLFKDGEELVTFRNVSDLKRLIDHYLPKQDERQAIAEAGKRRAHAEHTYRHRLELLLATVSGAEHGFPMPALPWDQSL